MYRALALAAAATLIHTVVYADARIEERLQVRYEGQLARLLNLFQPGSATVQLTNVVAVKGSRKLTLNDTSGQLIDLDSGIVYDLDVERKTYVANTFSDIRTRTAETRGNSRPPPGDNSGAPERPARATVSTTTSETGRSRVVNGFSVREIVITVTARDVRPTAAAGGAIVTSRVWLAGSIAGAAEAAAFARRYQAAIGGGVPSNLPGIATAATMYPMIGEALAHGEAETLKLDGTPVAATTTIDVIASLVTADASAPARQPAPEIGRANRSTVVTIDREVLSISGSVADSDVSIPAGFTLTDDPRPR